MTIKTKDFDTFSQGIVSSTSSSGPFKRIILECCSFETKKPRHQGWESLRWANQEQEEECTRESTASALSSSSLFPLQPNPEENICFEATEALFRLDKIVFDRIFWRLPLNWVWWYKTPAWWESWLRRPTWLFEVFLLWTGRSWLTRLSYLSLLSLHGT